jgi:hypothetical protein
MVVRDSKWRNRVIQASDTLNLGKCGVCGTFNPTIPGQGVAETCSGCGSTLFRHTMTVSASTFTPPKKEDLSKDENSDSVTWRTRRKRRRNVERLARSAEIKKELDGIGALPDQKGKQRKRHR